MAHTLTGRSPLLIAVLVLTSAPLPANWAWIGESVGPVRWGASAATREGVILMGTPGWSSLTKDGRTFELSTLPLDFLVHEVKSFDEGGVVLAVGEEGAIGLSDDAGRTWTQVRSRSPGSAHLRSVVWRDSLDRWMAVGDSGLTLESSDGRHWTPGPRFPDSYPVRRAVTMDGQVWILRRHFWTGAEPLWRLPPRSNAWEFPIGAGSILTDLVQRADGLIGIREGTGPFWIRSSVASGAPAMAMSTNHPIQKVIGTRTFMGAILQDSLLRSALLGYSDEGTASGPAPSGLWVDYEWDSLLTVAEAQDFAVAAGERGRLHSTTWIPSRSDPFWDRRDVPAAERAFTKIDLGNHLLFSGGRGLGSNSDPTDILRSAREAFPSSTVLASWTGRAWVAPVDSGFVLVSRDGEQWRRAQTRTTSPFVGFSHGLGRTAIPLVDGRLLISQDDSIFVASSNVPRTERFLGFAFSGQQFIGSYFDGTTCGSSDLESWKCVGPSPTRLRSMTRFGNLLYGVSSTSQVHVSTNHGFVWTQDKGPKKPVQALVVDGDSLWALHVDRTTSFRTAGDSTWRNGPSLPWHGLNNISHFLVHEGRVLASLAVPGRPTHRTAILSWTPPPTTRALPATKHRLAAPRWTLVGNRLVVEPVEPTSDWILEIRSLDGRIWSSLRAAGSHSRHRIEAPAPDKVFLAILRTQGGSWSRVFAAP